MMKWKKETKAYMWANYYSEDGKWVAWDEEVQVESSRKFYNPLTKKFESRVTFKHFWLLKNLETGETLPNEFKTLKSAKEYAELA